VRRQSKKQFPAILKKYKHAFSQMKIMFTRNI
jgi:hypothetical protein